MGQDQHVIPMDGKWAIQAAGEPEPFCFVQTQEEAVKIAQDIAMREEAELLIHDEDGEVEKRVDYGKDPLLLKG
ncbi:hypothetical protein AV656_08375 [Bhargavaea cecembensis]|uniref:DUF2188 domain-containing protein n=1 Tax=Bhargavaea cecembensis TaxID=394098 RepID=A0A163FLK6_9BACL|nr:DUF2188 domain-containing protein [Bhargavaea cecembensis]KZE38906.1 hypothetical protein AV656_08375 [Bhargavaea cecembensis]